MSTRNPAPPPRQEDKEKLRRQNQLKKQQKKRKRQRRRRMLLVSLPVAVLLALAIAIVGMLSKMVKIESYQVVGSEQYSAEEVWQASGLALGMNMLLAPLEEAQQAILRTLPFVQEVTLKRVFPYKIQFQVKETQLTLAVNAGAVPLLLDENGKVLEEGNAQMQQTQPSLVLNLPELDKPAVPGERVSLRPDAYGTDTLALLRDILAAAEQSGMREHITGIDLRSSSDVRLYYQNEICLLLGARTDFQQRLAWAKRVLLDMENSNALQQGTLDLTLDSQTPFRPNTASDKIEIPTTADSAKTTQPGSTTHATQPQTKKTTESSTTRPSSETQTARTTSQADYEAEPTNRER